jgi:predicted small lipoprotein YifL
MGPRMSRVFVALLALAALAGCAAHGPVDPLRPVVTERPAAATADSSVGPAENAVAPSDAPSGAPGTVQPVIAPVSVSRPPAEAARAFEVCSVPGWVDRNGIDVIAGIGRISHANEAAHYARLTGREPELQSDKPAWIVQFRGDIRMPWSNTIYVDPACVVVDGGDGGFFGTGGVREVGSDVTRTPQPIAAEPDRLLPPPQP